LDLTKHSQQGLAALSTKIERGADHPLVLVEASANKQLLQDTSIRLMTTHFQFFPTRKELIEQTLAKNDVDYAILFNSGHYPYDRNTIDPLVKTIKEKADLVDAVSGEYFDLDRNYGESYTADRPALDTFFLYKIRK
jgi:hypothetical protein